MSLKHLLFALLALVIIGCEKLPSAQDPVILENVPTMADVADSLNRVSANASKWSVIGDSIVHSQSYTIDWVKEFQAFLKDNVNKQRFADAYTITDSSRSSIRTIEFQALDETQEIRSVKIIINNGKVIHYSIHKERANLLSSSSQHFKFNGTSYELSIKQSIKWFFNNEQFVHGTILPQGQLWHADFEHRNARIPIEFIINADNELIVKNDEEFLTFLPASSEGDSSIYESAFFRSYFKLKLLNDSTLKGRWINEKTEIVRSIAVSATTMHPYRFKPSIVPEVNLSGNHKFMFLDHDGNIEETHVLKLEQNKFLLTGSLLTETGDYRFLEGVVRGDSMFLSTMDGTHLMYFEGHADKGKIKGVFLAGHSYSQKWMAELNTPHQLSSPESITKINSGESFSFSFPDENGEEVSIHDDQFKNKVLLVSIMGTWCSNCLDESRFLKEIYDEFPADQVAIVALDFELINDSLKAIQNILKYKRNIGIEYPILLAGLKSSKEVTAKALPSLNGIFSYPTLIVLDKNHDVVRIHTGFNGPATGQENYASFTKKYKSLISDLIQQ